MISKNVAILLLLIFAGAVTAAAQERGRVVDGQYIPAPGEVERNERMHKILQKAESFALELTPLTCDFKPTLRAGEGCGASGANSYPAGSKILFGLRVTNMTAETLEWVSGGYLGLYRPQLVKDGDTIPYRKKVVKLLSGGLTMSDKAVPVSLEAGQTTTRIVRLEDWYEPLEPGTYTLTVSHRLVEDGEWVVSPEIVFEITPK